MTSIIEQRRAVTRTRRPIIEAAARAAGQAGQTFTSACLARELGFPPSNVDTIVGQLVAEGLVTRLAFGDGYAWTDATPGVRVATAPASLADLLALARRETRADVVARKGRQSADVARDVTALTPAQLADVERLALLIERHAPAGIGAGFFRWDAAADGGRGAWALQAPVRRWVEAEHRAKCDRAGKGHWRPEHAKAAVSDYRGAVNNLCYLAATHGLIDRSPRNAGGANLYAASWAPALERWTRALLAAKSREQGRPYTNANRIRRGCRTLAVYATRAGGSCRRETDWLAVRAALEADRLAGQVADDDFKAARAVWRLVLAAFVDRVAFPASAAWGIPADDRMSLVSAAAIARAGRVDVGMAERDFSAWRMPDGRYPAGLIEHPMGLRAWAAWSTLADGPLRRAKLPPRVWDQAPRAGRRRRPTPAIVSAETLLTRLRMFAQLAGFAATHRDVDWTTAGLEALCDPALLDAFMAHSDERTPTSRGEDRNTSVRSLAQTLGWLVNGFLCARAKQQATDPAQLARLRQWYRTLEQLAGERPKAQSQDLVEVARRVVAIAAAWRGSDQQPGLLKIARLIDCLVGDACAAAGGRTLEEQADAIAAGTFTPTPAWARAIRMATLLTVAMRIPLRGQTWSKLTLAMWRVHRVGAELRGRELARWEGAISLEIPAVLMKSRREFRPAVILPAHVHTGEQEGSAAHEAGIRRELLRIYFMAGGARDVCCTPPGATSPDQVPWLFPDLLGEESGTRSRRTHDERGRWERRWLSPAFRDAVLRYAEALCLDPQRMRETPGALGFHSIRRLFGTYWAPLNPVHTSRMLDHTSVEFTVAVYVANDESVISLDVEAVELARGQEIVQLRAQIAELTRALTMTQG